MQKIWMYIIAHFWVIHTIMIIIIIIRRKLGRSKCLTLLAPYEFQGFLAATNTIVKPMIFQGFAQCAISSGTPWPPWFPCKPIFRPPTWRSQKTTSALSESGNGFAERSSHCVLIKTSPPQRGGVLSKCAENISQAQGPELICANRPL